MGFEKGELYRLPWSLNDNPIAWLEITDICNLHCEGCYRQRLTNHKPLEEIQEEVRFLKRWRNPDNVSIAGGEPLIHPRILEIVAYIAEQGLKPIILTNAQALTPTFLHQLKRAGLAGFTIHIDSHQGRPDWTGKNEAEHNALRQYYADMIHAEGGLYTIFNSTVYPSTYHEIPDVVRWGRENMDRVQGLVFITYRTGIADTNVALDENNQEVDLHQLSYVTDHFDERFVTGPEVAEMIQSACPEYAPSGYLGGTIRHDSYKWMAGAMIGIKGKVYGSVGKKTMELTQSMHHVFTGRYLAYLSQARMGAKVFMLSPWDRLVRQGGKRWLADLVRHPSHLFRPIYVQSIGIIQAPDLLPDGRADMCDSCPDMTYFEGKLVNSCRLDEYRLFGHMLSVAERQQREQDQAAQVENPAEEQPSEPTAVSLPQEHARVIADDGGERQAEE